MKNSVIGLVIAKKIFHLFTLLAAGKFLSYGWLPNIKIRKANPQLGMNKILRVYPDYREQFRKVKARVIPAFYGWLYLFTVVYNTT
jgi:hypothetical protein